MLCSQLLHDINVMQKVETHAHTHAHTQQSLVVELSFLGGIFLPPSLCLSLNKNLVGDNNIIITIDMIITVIYIIIVVFKYEFSF